MSRQYLLLLFLALAVVVPGGLGGTLRAEQGKEKKASAKGETRRHARPKLCVDSLVAVCAARTTDYTNSNSLVPYQEEIVNYGDAWQGNILNVVEQGVYFFHMSAGVRPNTPVHLSLSGLPDTVTLSRDSTTHDGYDVMGRDFIYQVPAGSNIYVTNDAESSLFAAADRQTSFSAINLEDILEPEGLTVFGVARDSLFASVGEVRFPIEFVNIGKGFDSGGMSRFLVKETGFYFLTLSVGVSRGLNVRVQIRATSRPGGPLAELWRSSDSHNGPDIISTAVLVPLFAGDEVYVDLIDGEVYSSDGHQAFFGGFHYKPNSVGGLQAAWCVYSESKHTSLESSLDPLPFDDQWTNTGDMFSFVDNSVNITVTGLYYINLNVGAQPQNKVDAYIVLSRNRVETNIYRSSESHNGEDTLNQGIIVHLDAGSNVRVVLGPQSRTHSDGDRQTIFTGFLLMPE